MIEELIKISNSRRISKEEYGMLLAVAAKLRSEDQFVKVGCVIENSEGRIIATGYNGLPSKFELSPQISNNRNDRRPFMIHAEVNALSLIKRGEGHTLYCTLHPCSHCIRSAVAHGIQTIVYLDDWINIDDDAKTLVKHNIITIKKFK